MITTLAIDVMGGDGGAAVVVKGASLALEKSVNHKLAFIFFGHQPKILEELQKFPNLAACSSVVHSDIIVTNDMKPAVAVRAGRKSNMGMAINAVAMGQADAVISAGNTGAYMALSKIILKTLPGIDRPAIPALMPTMKGKAVVLDVGANIECNTDNLIQFALMGEALACQILNLESPSVGLLNVGSEELKGNATIQEAYQFLRTLSDFRFSGFVEGDDITAGKTDVIVTDGFSGNVALKAIEGAARLIKSIITHSLSSSWLGRLGYLIGRSQFKKLQAQLDPRLYNGAVFLGLRHIAVKSHGGVDAIGFANSIDVAIQMVHKNLVHKIEQRLNLMNARIALESRRA